MTLPDELPMSMVLHLKLGKGGYVYHYRNEEHGISKVVGKQDRNSKAEVAFTIDGRDDQWPTYAELREAVQ